MANTCAALPKQYDECWHIIASLLSVIPKLWLEGGVGKGSAEVGRCFDVFAGTVIAPGWWRQEIAEGTEPPAEAQYVTGTQRWPIGDGAGRRTALGSNALQSPGDWSGVSAPRWRSPCRGCRGGAVEALWRCRSGL